MSTEETKKVAQELNDENLDEITGGVRPRNNAQQTTLICERCGKSYPCSCFKNSLGICDKCTEEIQKNGVTIIL